MTVKDVFGLIVRLAGLVFIICALFDLSFLLKVWLGLPLPAGHLPSDVFIATGLYSIVGVVLLACANLITRLVYGRGG